MLNRDDFPDVLNADHPLGDLFLAFSNENWAVSPSTALFLWEFLHRHRPRNIIETGSGLSTLIFSRYGATAVSSLEHDPHWAEVTRASLRREGLPDPVILAPLAGHPPCYAPDAADLGPAPFDLAFIDGPPGRVGRGPVLPLLAPHLAQGASILLDDANRPEERSIWEAWCRTFPLRDPIFVEGTDRGLAMATWEP